MPTNDRPGTGAASGGGGLMQAIQQQASSALSAQKTRAADGITTVTEAVRHTGDQLREKNGTLAGYVDTAAGQLERWSSQLRDRDVSELMDDVSAFARRRPAVFVGGGVALGLVAARFLKSSAAQGTSRMPEQPAQQFTTSGSDVIDVAGAAREPAAASVAADRSSSRAPRTRTRARTTDER